MYDIAKLAILIETGDIKKAQAELNRLTGQGQKTETSINKLNKSFGGLASTMAGFGAAFGAGAFFTKLTQTSIQFQSSLSKVQAVTRSTQDQMGELSKVARELGATTSFSAAQAAEGMSFLGMAGFNTNQIIKAMPATLQLAAAGGLDLARAADLASNALSGFGLKADEMGRVSDVLAATASRANTSVSQLGEALSYAAPFAASLGVDIESTAAAIGVLSDSGIQASRAGTGLGGVFRQLSKVTSEGEKVLQKYGINLADVDVQTRGLIPVLETIASKNLDAGDAIRLFGSEAGVAAQVLLKNIERNKELEESLRGARGEAEKMSKVMKDNLQGDLEALNSAYEELLLAIDESAGYTNTLRGYTQDLTKALRENKDKVAELAKAFAPFLEGAAIGAGVLAIGAGFAFLLTRINPVIAALTTVAGLINAAKEGGNGNVSSARNRRGNANGQSQQNQEQERTIELILEEAEALEKLAQGKGRSANSARERLKALNDELFDLIPSIEGATTATEQLAAAQEGANGATGDGVPTVTSLTDAQNDYLKALKEKLALSEAEAKQGKELTTGQKERIKIEKQFGKAFADSLQAQFDAIDLAEAEIDILNDLNKQNEDYEKQKQRATEASKRSTVELEKGNDQLKLEIQSIQGLLNPLDTLESSYYDLAAAKLESKLVSESDPALRAQLEREAQANRDRAKLLREKQSQEIKKENAEVAKQFEDDLVDAFETAFLRGGDFAESFKRAIEAQFAQMVLRPVISAFVSPISGVLSGVFGGGAAGVGGLGQATQALSLANGLQSVSNGFATLNSQILTTSYDLATMAGASVETAASFANAAGAVGTYAAGAGIGVFGGRAISGGYAISGSGNGLVNAGTAAGAILGGPVGAAIGGAIAGGINRAFGRKPFKTQAEGLIGDFSSEGFEGQYFRDQKAKGGLFRKSKRRTLLDDLDPQVERAFDASVEAIYDNFEQATRLLEVDLSKAVDQFTVSGRFAVKEAGDLNDVLNQVADSLVLQAIPNLKDFQLEGENLVQTATRLGVAVDLTNDIFTALGRTVTDQQRDFEFAEGFINTLGGSVQNLGGLMSFLYDETELAGIQTKLLDDALADAGIQLSATGKTSDQLTEEFKNLVGGIDLTTEAGQEQLAALLTLYPEIINVIDAQAQLEAQEKALAEAARQTAKSIAEQIFEADQTYQQFLRNVQDRTNGLEVDTFATSVDGLQAQIDALQTRVATVDFSSFLARLNVIQAEIGELGINIQEAFSADEAQELQRLIEQRYQLEIQLLGQVYGEIDNLLNNITSERVAVRQDAASILGGSTAKTFEELSESLATVGDVAQAVIAQLDALPSVEAYMSSERPIEELNRLYDAGQEQAFRQAKLDNAATATANQLNFFRSRESLRDQELQNEINNRNAATALFGRDARGSSQDTIGGFAYTVFDQTGIRGGLNLGYDRGNRRLFGTDAGAQQRIDQVRAGQRSLGSQRFGGFVSGAQVRDNFNRFEGMFNLYYDYLEAETRARQHAINYQNEANRALDEYNRLAGVQAQKQADLNAATTQLTEAEKAYQDALTEYQIGLLKLENERIEKLAEFSGQAEASVRALSRLRGEVVTFFQENERLANLMNGAAQGIRSTIDQIRFDDLGAIDQLDQLLSDFDKARTLASISTGDELAKYGNEINSLIGPILDKAAEVYASGSQFQNIKELVLGQAESVADRLEELAPKDYQEQSLQLLSSIDENLLKLEDATLLAEALIVQAIERSSQRNNSDLTLIGGQLTGLTPEDFATISGEYRERAFPREDIVESALGNVFSNGMVQAFANGGAFTNGIVSKPTLFNMGLMGEAGSEAIMPLARSSNGALGVRVVGGMNNADLLAEMREANRLAQAQIRIAQATAQQAMADNAEMKAELQMLRKKAQLAGAE